MQNFVLPSKGRASEKVKRKDNFKQKAGLRQKEKDSGKEANTSGNSPTLPISENTK